MAPYEVCWNITTTPDEESADMRGMLGNRTATGRRRTRAVWVVPPEERPTNDQEEGTHRAEEDEHRYRAG